MVFLYAGVQIQPSSLAVLAGRFVNIPGRYAPNRLKNVNFDIKMTILTEK